MSKKFTTNEKGNVPLPSQNGSMRMFDLDNPDIQLFNLVDDEIIRLFDYPKGMPSAFDYSESNKNN